MKAQAISLTRLPFAHCANGSLWFVSLFRKKQTEVIRLLSNLTDYTYWPIYYWQNC
jgi:hypothetical protein